MKNGKRPPFADGHIAAIAWASGLTLVTANVKDFRGFTRLKVETWMVRSGRRRSPASVRVARERSTFRPRTAPI